jgi:cytidylate kinase
MRDRPVVAIDGPAGAGKSTVARRLAARLGFTLVDTGALYRAVALASRRAGVAWDDDQAATAVALRIVASRALALLPDADKGVRVILEGEDVSDAIRAADMGMGASRVSAIGGVREALFQLQRLAGEQGGVVLEGRDIGTVVFPDAEVKFFLTASPEVRARRRYDELVQRGERVDYDATLEDVRVRDQQDTTRSIAPLRQAEDATLIDSSGRTIDEVVEEMADKVSSHLTSWRRLVFLRWPFSHSSWRAARPLRRPGRQNRPSTLSHLRIFCRTISISSFASTCAASETNRHSRKLCTMWPRRAGRACSDGCCPRSNDLAPFSSGAA